MFSFDLKIVKFENPADTWYQIRITKYFLGFRYSRTYYSTGYGEHTKPVKYHDIESAKKDEKSLFERLEVNYNTKTKITVIQ